MPDILIRDLDEAVVARLKKRAKANNRSLQAELQMIVESAARTDMDRLHAAIEKLRTDLGDHMQSDSAELIAEARRSR